MKKSNLPQEKQEALDGGFSSLLHGVEFFKHFPEQLLEKLSSHLIIKDYLQGEVILNQGQLNSDLYILVSGALSVLVDGGLVATMNQRGDLVGEMSVISRQPVAATIVATVPAKVLILREQEIHQVERTEADSFQQAIYRIYAQDLSRKLRITNQKAKYFEELTTQLTAAQENLRDINRDLEQKIESRTLDLQKRTQDLQKSHQKLEQQNAELVVSHKKMEELYFTRELTFQKLQELYKDFLIPLQMTLLQLDQETMTGGAQQQLVQMASRELSQVLQLLEPVASIYSSQQAMKSKKVLLAEPNKKHQILAKMALGGTGVELDIVSNLEEGQKNLTQKTYDILFVSVEMLELCLLAKNLNPLCHPVFMTSERIDKYLPELLKHKIMPHIVSRDENDRTFTIRNIVTSVAKLASGDLFGVSKYLAWGSEIKSGIISRSDERERTIEEVDQHFEKLGVRRTVRERVAATIEEMLMNAIYDAPVDSDGHSLFNHLSRLELVELTGEQQGRLKYGTDGMILAVSVEDPFGSLEEGTILRYLDKCYGGAETGHEAGTKKGGGGRGLYQIIESSDLVVFNLHPGVKTEVIALFNVDIKDAGEKAPSFHLFRQ